jgi:glycosyltransferase involved in cell wall biosynthesis
MKVLLPMACDGVGPSFTCLQITSALLHAEYPSDVHAIRQRGPRPPVPLCLAFPGVLGLLPFRHFSRLGRMWIERRYLTKIRETDIAYLWPSVSYDTHRILHERGIPIVLEGINTRMQSAKQILDQAYDAFGSAPAHGITEERVLEEERKYELASAIFAPSHAVETALQNSAIDRGILPSSYGAVTARAAPKSDYRAAGKPLVFIFCGFAGIRKGIHHLLEAWKHVPPPHRLRIVGRIEPAISERYSDILASERVELTGFVHDVHAQFASADVFVMPSLEEGDPLVTYEAALHGLPVIATPMGGGRMGDTPGAMALILPGDIDALAKVMIDLAASDELREASGRAIRELALEFDWLKVGARRAEILRATFPG